MLLQKNRIGYQGTKINSRNLAICCIHKKPYHDYTSLVEYAKNYLSLDMKDISNKQVCIIWTDFEEIQSKRSHIKIIEQENSKDSLSTFCDNDDNKGDLECRIYDL